VYKGHLVARVRGEATPPPVFIVGSDRSGTHWLGRILDAHPDVEVTFEPQPVFRWSMDMAIDPAEERELFPRMVAGYRYQRVVVAPRMYVDKSHPNLWIAERLMDVFPDASFVGIHREVYPTVASMLKHPGAAWLDSRWTEFPVPNRFMGITGEMATRYGDLPLPSKYALRWKAHYDELRRLQGVLGHQLHVISYEQLQQSTLEEIDRLGDFLKLRAPIPTPPVRRESLDRWRLELSPETMRQIDDVLSTY